MAVSSENKADKKKFELLYASHKNAMFAYSNYILKDPQLAEDAVQDAFIAVLDNLDKIDDPFSKKTRCYLITIVKNAAYKIYNKRKKEVVCDDPDIFSITDDSCVDDDAKELMSAINTLNINYSSVLVLKYYIGLTDKEISQSLDISEVNVRARLARAKAALKKMLAKEDETNG